MAIFTKIGGFVAQISLYIKNNDYGEAYLLAKDMCKAYPADMISHFLLAKSAFWQKKYEEAAAEGEKALSLCPSGQDAVSCAVLISTARFMLGQYPDGMKLLQQFENVQDERIEEMMAIYSAARGDLAGMKKHIRALLRLNRKSGEELMARFLEGYPGEQA
jgi:tetratricopeptide (TPR) repeat protein